MLKKFNLNSSEISLIKTFWYCFHAKCCINMTYFHDTVLHSKRVDFDHCVVSAVF